MATCDVCGNDYWMAFEIRTITGEKYTFDSFECAIQRLAPLCEHCKCRIIGHGVEVEGRFFCCAHCARKGADTLGQQIRDTVGAHPG
ncbi:Prokaryotic metallothionein [Streptoalloteichus hindustanus]|uniref:Metallothionein n=1 Tax=Streptoalloteichus hindustanus TaxID=2017 RepID=A0A1M5PCW8_STRHI|nr:Prokaryotic metallothionein [Streptoalloteichus hindustanus]SHG99319.1 hypothetical protein SAMN05444320_1184 [Streptoalloteichus hindustanus]